MTSEVRWLKASFLAGAVADGLVTIQMLMPSRMGETEFRTPMGLAASLMLGWTFLLLWGYRKPVERKALLLLTIFPVITGLLLTAVYQALAGAVPVAQVFPNMTIGIVLIGLMGYSYYNARTLDVGDERVFNR